MVGGTAALGIDGTAHGASFLRAANCGIRAGDPLEPVAGPRIGISRAQNLPWRFGDPASRSLSRPFR
jgi:DNA-3-methyladenine glycosylase